MSTAYLNGVFLPLDQAHVSVMDRGFLFGDGVYEVIPVYGGKLFRLGHHLRRLQNSLDAVRIGNPLAEDEWKSMLAQLVAGNEGPDQTVYLQVTRGVAPRRDHAFPVDSRPTVFAMCTPCLVSHEVDTEPGVTAITLADIRWQHCDIKAITLLPNILLRQQAIDANTVEAILLKDGYAIEGAASEPVPAVREGRDRDRIGVVRGVHDANRVGDGRANLGRGRCRGLRDLDGRRILDSDAEVGVSLVETFRGRTGQ